MSLARAVKSIVFTAQAHEHHTSVKIRNVLKWLKSGHEVRVKISGGPDRMKAMESIYNQLQNDAKVGAKFGTKTIKSNSIGVVLTPTKEAANLVISEPKEERTAEEELSDVLGDQDIFSEEFDKNLNQSIKNEASKNKKR